MRLGHNQKSLIQILTHEKMNKEELMQLLNLRPSEFNRILDSLDNKQLLKNEDDFVMINQKFEKNFAKDITRKDYYQSLWDSNIFKNTEFGIKLETDIFYYHTLNMSLYDNESLKLLKIKDEKFYNRLRTGIFENINFQIINLKRKIATWSEDIHEIDIDSERNKIRIIDTKTKTVSILKEQYKRLNLVYAKTIYECVHLLKKTLQELLEFTISVATKDYSNFLESHCLVFDKGILP